MNTAWKEQYIGGSELVEERRFREFADAIKAVQARIRKRERAPRVMRAFHAKIHMGVMNGVFRVLPEVPPELRIPFFTPGAEYAGVAVRFSNASGGVRPDWEKDMRGVALRVVTQCGAHDFLMTNFPVSHARDAAQFMVAARAAAHKSRVRGFLTLLFGLGPFEAVRMAIAVRKASKKVDSVATETYWSRAPIAVGEYAVKYQLKPVESSLSPPVDQSDPNYLRMDLRGRLASGALHFHFCVQPWTSEGETSIENGLDAWEKSPVIPIAELIVPRQDLSTDEARETEATVDLMQFNPWRTEHEMRPLGSMNRARKLVYSASSAHWSGRAVPPSKLGVLTRLYDKLNEAFFSALNRFVVWHHLPTWLAVMNLAAIRERLRHQNLHGTMTPVPTADPTLQPLDPAAVVRRTHDGSGNDLAEPAMGAAEARFGRNMPIEALKRLYGQRRGNDPDNRDGWLLDPSPREISRKLLERKEFIPASTLNLLAAAWIQFQTHDWFNHGKLQNPRPEDFIEVPLAGDDSWPGRRMLVPRTRPDPTRGPLDRAFDPLPTFRNIGSHWWDGSQVYGSDQATTDKLRERKGGCLRVSDKEMLPIDDHGMELSGFTDNWWLGLSLLHTLFAKEHNAVCDRLHRHNPKWSDDQLFHTGRLIVTALLAKIHTIEWTPAILGNEALKIAMNVNWWGLTGEGFKRAMGRISDSEAISGIVGSPPAHHGAPFTLTEEFVCVYRMHPLVPDQIPLRPLAGEKLRWIQTKDYLMENVDNIRETGFGPEDLCYSFGRTHPGAITLFNHPDFLRNLDAPGAPGGKIDLGTIDILRDRERGVPRYNDFRKLVHLPRLRSFDQLNAKHARVLSDVYGGDTDKVDPMIGMYAETPPHGFGFSDTAFRIFVLMASRRLKSDRFFTTDYSREVYTQVGLDWIDENNMSSILIRHFPQLAPALHGLGNAFVPWKPLGYPVPQAQPGPAQAATEAQPDVGAP
jgi:hypothetical protein